jgi:cobalt-zinc-cadmium efflux system protein
MSGSHAHDHSTDAGGRLRVVLAIVVTILVAEVVGGVVAHSLVLLADAAHMTADAAGIGLSLFAVMLARRPPTKDRTFGLQRAEILAAVANAVLLLVLGTLLLVEAVRRLLDPGHPEPLAMLVFGVVAVIGNTVGLLVLRGGQGQSLNVRGAYLEVLSDLLGAVAVLVAAGIIALTGFRRADPLASLLIAVLIVPRTVRLLRQAIDVLLEATPEHVDLDDVRTHILEAPGVVSCHDLHAWTITGGHAVLSVHVVVDEQCWRDGSAPDVLTRLQSCLAGHFDVEHSTFQLEHPSHEDSEAALHA